MRLLVLLSTIQYIAPGATAIPGLKLSLGDFSWETDDVSSIGPGLGGAPILVRTDGLPSSLERSGGIIQVARPSDFKNTEILPQMRTETEKSLWNVIANMWRRLKLVEDEKFREEPLNEKVRIQLPEETKVTIKVKEGKESLPIIRPATNTGKLISRGKMDLPVIRPATNLPEDFQDKAPIKRSKDRQAVGAFRLRELLSEKPYKKYA